MRERRWLLLALYGLFLAFAVAGALKATRPKFKIATTSTTTTTTEEPDVADNEDGDIDGTTVSAEVNATTRRTLTGIPQIDYIWDPNLPRELNGYNLSEYPFYSGIPEEIDFKCDGLHDGFYASVPHKCQVYHHCLYGTRYDFLCANFTAFDQRTFICHFASEVDCANSKKHWHRNDALYKTAETTTTSTTTTTTSTTTTTQPPGPRPGSRRRRPFRRRPAYDYYEEEYYDDEGTYERTRPRGYDRRDDYDYDDRKYVRRDRERDRDFRDRDYRDRETTRSREPERPLRDPERTVKDDREVPLSPRERFPSRNNRRDPVRSAAAAAASPRDPLPEDEPRNRNRDQDLPIRSREPEESSVDDRRTFDSRNRDVDDRRYSDKGFRDDYEDEPVGSSASTGGSDILVKPAAPAASVYARPRAAPKIRRPVPITEQDKFAYKTTLAPPIAAGETRRRPAEILSDDEYYEEDLEEVRPRRPASRRRPGFRDFYESPRERDRDRPFRSRYREDIDEVRPRKHPERNRERYYERGPERGRDRSLDRSKERASERIPESTRDRTAGRLPESDRTITGRPLERERDIDRPRSSSRSKEPAEVIETTRRTSIYDRTSVAPLTSSTTSTSTPKDEGTIQNSSERPDRPFRHRQDGQTTAGRNASGKSEPPSRQNPVEDNQDNRDDPVEPEPIRLDTSARDENTAKETSKTKGETEEYSSLEEYYDDLEYHPAPPPSSRTTVRVVKRPFLPSRGGNPNPRGLSLVGSKAPESSRKSETPSTRPPPIPSPQSHTESYRIAGDHRSSEKSTSDVTSNDDKRHYDDYKTIQNPVSQKTRSEDYEEVITRPSARRPAENSYRDEDDFSSVGNLPTEKNRGETQSARNNGNERENSGGARNVAGTRGRNSNEEEPSHREKTQGKWNSEEYRLGHRGDVRHEQETTPAINSGTPGRSKTRVTEDSGYYESTYVSDNADRDQPTLSTGNLAANKPTLNEVVTHHRLQDIPESEYDVTLNEALTPSFSNQEGNLPSGFVLPIHRQLGNDPILQSTENSYKVSRPYNQPIASQQQQKPFVPSPQFLPLAEIGSGNNNNNNERSRSIQYFRTPEAVHVTGPQYRHQRGPWHDYTGY